MLIMQRGIIVGSDAGGVLYDGTYRDQGDRLDVRLTMTRSPGRDPRAGDTGAANCLFDTNQCIAVQKGAYDR